MLPCSRDDRCRPDEVLSAQVLGWSADVDGAVGRAVRVRLRKDPKVFHLLRSPQQRELSCGQPLCVRLQTNDAQGAREICQRSLA